MLERTRGVASRTNITFGFAKVLYIARFEVVKVDVAIRADCIVKTGKFTASVSNLLAIWTPSQLFYTTKGKHGTFVRFTLKKVLALTYFIAVKVSNKGVRRRSCVVIPMLINKVVGNDSSSKCQISVILLNALLMRDGLDENHLFTTG